MEHSYTPGIRPAVTRRSQQISDIHQMIDYFTAWNDRDAQRLEMMVSENVVFEGPNWGKLTDQPSFGAHVENLLAAFTDLNFHVESLDRYDDGHAVGQWTLYGTNTGPIFDLPPTHRQVSLRGADFFSFERGRVASIRTFLDTLSMARQLGLQVAVGRPNPRIAELSKEAGRRVRRDAPTKWALPYRRSRLA